MDKNFRERLSFSEPTQAAVVARENWREALALLPDLTVTQPSNPQTSPKLLNLPNLPADEPEPPYLTWVITEASHATCVQLAPYCVDNITTYRVPSLSHVLSHLTLRAFDHAWLRFFAESFSHDNTSVVLDSEILIQAVLWALAREQRLALASNHTPLQIGEPLTLKARLRYSEEWALWALNAELITAAG